MKSTERPDRDTAAAESPAVRQLCLSWDQLILDTGILHRISVSKYGSLTDGIKQVVVPTCLRSGVLSAMHDSVIAGHLGVKKTYHNVKRCFYLIGQELNQMLNTGYIPVRNVERGRGHQERHEHL